MDKLIYSESGEPTISNDGATIMRLLQIVHPAAQTLVHIARSQDEQVGDGTTSVVVLAGEFLQQSKEFIEENVAPNLVIRAFRTACDLARAKVEELSVKVDTSDAAKMREMLERFAGTSMNSKLIAGAKKFFSKMVVDAVMHLEEDCDSAMIGVKKEQGGSLEDTLLVEGVAFKKTFSYAGFEQQPKYFKKPKVLLLNVELELKAEKDNAKVRVDKVEDYQSLVDAEWQIIYKKLEACVESGAVVVLSRLAIGDLATQYFADRGVFCAGRCVPADLARVAKATGAVIQTSLRDITPKVLGVCGVFEERQIGKERYNVFSECTGSKTVTFIIRGGGVNYIDEVERSLHDAISVVRRARKQCQSVVAGGGAIEMEISKYLRTYSRTIHGKAQLVVNAYAKALEVIPRTIAQNAGLDSVDILNKLRHKHAQGGTWFGIDINTGGVCDTYENFVWEPSLVKTNAIIAATEAACLILSIDETVRNPRSEQEQW
jgi:T-complex protein 1 subunit eta